MKEKCEKMCYFVECSLGVLYELWEPAEVFGSYYDLWNQNKSLTSTLTPSSSRRLALSEFY